MEGEIEMAGTDQYDFTVPNSGSFQHGLTIPYETLTDHNGVPLVGMVAVVGVKSDVKMDDVVALLDKKIKSWESVFGIKLNEQQIMFLNDGIWTGIDFMRSQVKIARENG